jgi:hypothetical protein
MKTKERTFEEWMEYWRQEGRADLAEKMLRDNEARKAAKGKP